MLLYNCVDIQFQFKNDDSVKVLFYNQTLFWHPDMEGSIRNIWQHHWSTVEEIRLVSKYSNFVFHIIQKITYLAVICILLFYQP